MYLKPKLLVAGGGAYDHLEFALECGYGEALVEPPLRPDLRRRARHIERYNRHGVLVLREYLLFVGVVLRNGL